MNDYHFAMDSGARPAVIPGDAPTIDEIVAALDRLPPLAWRTPFVPSAWLSELVGGDVRLKLEIVQQTGSFKIRGAANAIALLKTRHPGVTRIITASAGNHGQAVALAGRRADLPVRVFVPASAPAAKRDALLRLGAEVMLTETYEAAEAAAHADVRAGNGVYVSPYNDPDVVAGAGTAALEMFEAAPHLDTIIAAVGGGGLLSGTGIVARAAEHSVQVIGVEAEASPVFTSAFAANSIVTVNVRPTLADGLAGNLEPGSRTFEWARAVTDQMVAVGESAIAEAMRGLVHHDRLVVEGAGAVGVAALLSPGLGLDLMGRTVGIILSGRNVDADVLARILAGP
jgi:threonine dehydratase